VRVTQTTIIIFLPFLVRYMHHNDPDVGRVSFTFVKSKNVEGKHEIKTHKYSRRHFVTKNIRTLQKHDMQYVRIRNHV
jgi:hypothetical protein